MDERPNWEEIRAQLKSARDTLTADERQRQSASTIPQTPPVATAKSADPSAAVQARLEARARQRRIERRSAAARSAMQRGGLVEAQAVLSEIQELDPNHPEVISLGRALGEAQFNEAQDALSRIQELDPSHPEDILFGRALGEVQLHAPQAALSVVQELELRHPEVISFEDRFKEAPGAFEEARQYKPETRRKKGPALAAAAVFAIGLLAASQLGRPDGFLRPLASVQFAGFANLISEGTAQTVVFLTGNDSTADRDEERREPPAAATVPPATNVVQAPPRPVETVVAAPVPTPIAPIPPAPAPASIESAAPIAAPPPRAPEPAVVTRDNSEQLILQALDRYRAAYEKLDARSAQQVWPNVDEQALARAFTGLRSQALTFDGCKVRISGDVATAACVGSTRYVPRVGSQQPRIESRIWDFTLRQTGTDWRIESARVDR